MIRYRLDMQLPLAAKPEHIAEALDAAAAQVRQRASVEAATNMLLDGHATIRVQHGVTSIERPPVRVGDLPDRDDD